jgi:hypothetical protein
MLNNFNKMYLNGARAINVVAALGACVVAGAVSLSTAGAASALPPPAPVIRPTVVVPAPAKSSSAAPVGHLSAPQIGAIAKDDAAFKTARSRVNADKTDVLALENQRKRAFSKMDFKGAAQLDAKIKVENKKISTDEKTEFTAAQGLAKWGKDDMSSATGKLDFDQADTITKSAALKNIEGVHTSGKDAAKSKSDTIKAYEQQLKNDAADEKVEQTAIRNGQK